jgi:hypothetical protein
MIRPGSGDCVRSPTPFTPTTPTQHALAAALDTLNAFDAAVEALDDLPLARRHGPAIRGGANWLGVLLWVTGRGYGGFRSLALLGIWALAPADAPTIACGLRSLTYSAPVYQPEAFHALIRRDFSLYYADEGGPPTEGEGLRFPWAVDDRLAHRLAIAEHLRQLANCVE